MNEITIEEKKILELVALIDAFSTLGISENSGFIRENPLYLASEFLRQDKERKAIYYPNSLLLFMIHEIDFFIKILELLFFASDEVVIKRGIGLETLLVKIDSENLKSIIYLPNREYEEVYKVSSFSSDEILQSIIGKYEDQLKQIEEILKNNSIIPKKRPHTHL